MTGQEMMMMMMTRALPPDGPGEECRHRRGRQRNVTFNDRPTRGKIRVNHVVDVASASNVAVTAAAATAATVVGIRYNGRFSSPSPPPLAFL